MAAESIKVVKPSEVFEKIYREVNFRTNEAKKLAGKESLGSDDNLQILRNSVSKVEEEYKKG